MQDYLNDFIGLIGSISGVFVIILCLLILTNRSSYSLWLGFGFCAFMASLVSPPNDSYLSQGDLVFPFDELRAFGRPITVLVLLSLSLRYFSSGQNLPQKISVPKQVLFIFITLFVINFKILLSGDIGFAVLNTVTIGFVWLLIMGLWKNLNYYDNLDLATYSISFGGLLFAGSSLYQSFFDSAPLIFGNGQFVGMTNNPQMTGLIFSFTLPSLLFNWERSKKSFFLKTTFFLGILSTFCCIYLTGSRTALLASCICLLAYYYNRPIMLFKLILSFAFVAFVSDNIFPNISYDFFVDSSVGGSANLATERFTNITDTRTQVWGILWSQFLENPFFGIPLTGGRIGFGENTWLAVAATLGLLGLTPLVLFGISSFKSIFNINSYLFSDRNTIEKCYFSLVNASYSVIFINSVAEAYLLGSLTFPLFCAIAYLLINAYIEKQIMVANEKSKQIFN